MRPAFLTGINRSGTGCPTAEFSGAAQVVTSLHDILADVDAFVFDAFGVLNVGETPIPGAAERLDALRASGRAIRILSNAATYNHERAAEKFQRLGMRVGSEEIITSRDATITTLDQKLWCCIAASSDDLSDIPTDTLRLKDDGSAYDCVDGILFLSAETWTPQRQAMLATSLRENPRPVLITNADVAAPRDYGFSLEPGHFGHMLADAGLGGITFFGKPFPTIFEMAARSLGDMPAHRIGMCGDTLHTDILGAAAQGWRTVLVEQDGMYSGMDASAFSHRAGITPNWRLARI